MGCEIDIHDEAYHKSEAFLGGLFLLAVVIGAVLAVCN